MFDDQPNQGAVNPPKNLPLSEPEDIFDSVDSSTQPVETSASAPTSLPSTSPSVPPAMEKEVSAPPTPSETKAAPPSALDAGVLRAKADGLSEPETPSQVPREQPTSSLPPVLDQNTEGMSAPKPAGKQEIQYQIKNPSISRGIITVVVIIIVLGILGGGGWWIYANFIQTPAIQEGPAVTVPDLDDQNENLPEDTGENTVLLGTSTEDNDPSEQVVDDEVLFGEPVDRDADGIDDATEERIGTDPNNWDSDGDELSDGDEILVWETDPMNPDTDGDGFLDGAEVRNGYNPAGEGRIFEAPTATSTTSTATQ